MRQTEAPLWQAMQKHQQQSRGNFHVPGHKQGQAFDAEANVAFASLLPYDLTEVGMLDDLHQANGVIEQAQHLAAEAFGSEQCYFLVGGTTAGNLASLLTVAESGKKILVQRSSHQSVFHGLFLARAEGWIVAGEIDPQTGWEKPLTVEQVEPILRRESIGAVMITSPSYFGVPQPVAALASLCHRYQIPLLVDEAHGAHFAFHPQLPPSALEQGADVVIQSTHKMLPAMTMASMLHIQGSRIDRQVLQKYLRMIQSSSPSYPLMASLDLARRLMATKGRELIEQCLQRLQGFRQRWLATSSWKEVRLTEEQDPFKITIRANGYRLDDYCQQQGIYPEMATPDATLFACSIGTTERELQRLEDCLCTAPEMLRQPTFATKKHTAYELESRFSFQQLKSRSQVRIPLRQANGFRSAEWIIPYPPGIPYVLPGERWKKTMQDECEQICRQGGKVRGIDEQVQVSVWLEESER
jgi:arginine/lysine/ornithine decarboxylase